MNKSFLLLCLYFMIGTHAWGYYFPELETFENINNLYLGGSANMEYLSGCRADGQSFSGGGGETYNHGMHINNAAAGFELFFGYLHHINNTLFALGFEPFISIRRFNEHHASGEVSSVLQRANLSKKWDFGFTFRSGLIFWEKLFIYGLLGPEFGLFRLMNCSDSGEVTIAHKWIPAARYGVGLEYIWRTLILGIQLSVSNYEKSRIFKSDSTGNEVQVHTKPKILSLNLRVSIPVL